MIDHTGRNLYLILIYIQSTISRILFTVIIISLYNHTQHYIGIYRAEDYTLFIISLCYLHV
jgi:inner membrane protein involved in colicin E2 resistance